VHRTIRGAIVAAALLLAAKEPALAQSITGSWKATLGQAQLVFTFQSAGSAYKGTFTTITSYVDAQHKQRTASTVQQLIAVSKTANQQQTITVTIQAMKNALVKKPAMITCKVEKSSLACYSPVTRAYVTFTPMKH
jgi:polyisoprenoid-binding protein YceI